MSQSINTVELAAGPPAAAFVRKLSKFGPLFALFVAVIVVVIGRSVTWMDPPTTDTRVYAYVGRAWLSGDVPYVRVWEMKPPGIFAANAAVFALFPDSFHALAIVEGFCMLGCALTVYLLLRQFEIRRVTSYLGAVLFLVVANSEWSFSNLTEIYLLWPAALSMLFFAKSVPDLRGKWMFLAGLFTGIASTFKPTGLSPFLAQATFLLLSWLIFRRYSISRVVTAISIVASGVALGWVPFTVYFAWHGALAEMIKATLVYPLNYAAAVPMSIGLYLRLTGFLLGRLYILVVFAVFGILFYFRDLVVNVFDRRDGQLSRTPFYLLAVVWVAFDLAGALAGRRSGYQYVLPVALSLSVLIAFTYSQELDLITNARSRLLVSALLLSPLLVMYVNYEIRQFVHVARYGHNLYHDAYVGHDQPTQGEETKEIAAFIDGMRQPDDTLFSWDLNPSVFQRLHIKSPIPQLDLAFRTLFTGSVRESFVHQVLGGLRSHPPTFVMDSSDPSEKQDPLYADFFNLIDRQYDLVREFRLRYNRFRLYRRRRLT